MSSGSFQDITVTDFSPTEDLGQNLGTPELRWKEIFATKLSDGEKNIDMAGLLDAAEGMQTVDIAIADINSKNDMLSQNILSEAETRQQSDANLQTQINQKVANDDSRLSNSRTPLAHANTHNGGGSDPIPEATIVHSGLMSATDRSYIDGRYPVGGFNYYVDPSGDTSQNTPGTSSAPFKSPMYALRILRKRYNGIEGTVNILLNPGEYAAETFSLVNPPLGPCIININPVDINNLPTLNITGNLYLRNVGVMSFGPMNYNISGNVYVNSGAYVVMGSTTAPSKIKIGSTATIFFSSDYNGQLILQGEWSLDGSNGGGGNFIFNSTEGFFSALNTKIILHDFSKSFRFFAHTIGGSFDFRSMTFDISDTQITSKFYAVAGAIIWTGGAGANFLPGINSGSTDAGSFYL